MYSTFTETAINLFSMLTSSATLERGFLAMGFVHSKLSSQLVADEVQKWVFIKKHAAQTMYSHQVGIDRVETDADEKNS